MQKPKHIVHKIKPSPFWFETDFNMNIYRGCSHGCIYCDSRSECYHIENFDTVRAKDNALEIIEKDLKSRRSRGVVAQGAMSDPYNPLEENLCLTRSTLELLDRYGYGASLTTKSPLITRDKDILKRISKHSSVIVKITLTCACDALSNKVEPRVAPSSARFGALKELTAEGIFAGVLMMPLLPFINDTRENILSIVKKAKEADAKFIFPSFGVTLRANQREYFFKQLDMLFPGLKEKYKKTYGYEYSCTSLNYKSLYSTFTAACKNAGILYKMPDIIKAYKKPFNLELFDLQ